MGAIKQLMTAAGSLHVVTAKEFVDILLIRNGENIANTIADVALLGLENDGKPPVIKMCHIKNSISFCSASFNNNYISEDEDTYEYRLIKLAVMDKSPEIEMLNQLEKIIHFKESSEYKNPKRDPYELARICDDLALQSLEHFGQPDYLIDFGDGKYAVVPLEDISIETCVYNKQVRAGIIYKRRTAFGLKVKEMK